MDVNTVCTVITVACTVVTTACLVIQTRQAIAAKAAKLFRLVRR